MKAGRRTLMIALVLTVLHGVATAAQTKPDVSGTWKMNRAKSTFSGGGGPEGITIKFEQQGQTLREVFTVARSQGDRTMNLTYTVDGKPGTNQIEGNDMTTVASWEGSSLVIVFKRDDGSFTRKFTMSEDGKSMTIAVRQTNSQGEKDDTVFLEKQ